MAKTYPNKAIFFHAAEQFVRDEIANREVQYGAAKRAGFHSKRDHASFLHGKTAWARAKAGDKTLENSKQDLFESYYQREGDGNYVPRPGLIDVSIRHDGDYGTIQRATVNFIVFNISQLEELECAFLSVGRDVTIEYGWTVSGRSGTDEAANSDKFKGIINNFSYTLNKEGGFDCTFDAVGPGYFTVGTDPTSLGSQSESPVTEDESEIPDIPFTGVIKVIRNEVKETKSLTHGKPVNGNIVPFELGFILSSGEADDSNNGENKNAKRLYTTLGYLVEVINREIKNLVKETNNKFICDSDTTVGHRDPWIKSAATQHIIFPSVSQGNYETQALQKLISEIPPDVQAKLKTNLLNAVKTEKIKNSTKLDFSCGGLIPFDNPINQNEVDLSKILINLDTLQVIKTTLVLAEHKNTTVKNFLTELFKVIKDCSGGAYDLSIIPDPHNLTDMLIVNNRYNEETIEEKQWVIFKPFTTRSVVRDISLSSQIPDDLSTVAYVAARGGDANTNHYPEHVAKMLSGGQCNDNNQKNATEADVPGSGVLLNTPINAAQASADAPIDPNVNKQIQDQQKAKEAKDAADVAKANLYAPLFLDYLIGPRQSIPLEEMGKSVYFSPVQTVGITGYPAFVTRKEDGKTKWNSKMPIPLQFGVTIDGISGFKFGDVVGTTYLPSKYKDTGNGGYKAAFTVTKVNHTISNNDWTTQLETVCRLV